MNRWKHIVEEKDLQEIITLSENKPQIIFKHSTRCGISHQAESRLIDGADRLLAVADFHFLDLLNYRNLSNLIADQLDVTHQSPQIIVLKDGAVTYVSTHHSIDVNKILSALS